MNRLIVTLTLLTLAAGCKAPSPGEQLRARCSSIIDAAGDVTVFRHDVPAVIEDGFKAARYHFVNEATNQTLQEELDSRFESWNHTGRTEWIKKHHPDTWNQALTDAVAREREKLVRRCILAGGGLR